MCFYNKSEMVQKKNTNIKRTYCSLFIYTDTATLDVNLLNNNYSVANNCNNYHLWRMDQDNLYSLSFICSFSVA